MRCIVLIKQVPDTKNITADTMKEDGTVNRAALPAIFNPDDLCALELALQTKDRYQAEIYVLSMGPPRAVEILRDALSRGADQAVLLSDRRFAAADTLATSYTLAQAIRKIGDFDLIFCGRQAIDGDTAQVGPQVAEKLGLPQATYAQELWCEDGFVYVRREVEGGYEVVKLKSPALITVTGGYVLPRPKSAKRLIRFRHATTRLGLAIDLKKKNPDATEEELNNLVDQTAGQLSGKNCLIPVWGTDEIDIDAQRIGLAGSPTRVWRVQKVTLQSGESKTVEATQDGINAFMQELLDDHVLG